MSPFFSFDCPKCKARVQKALVTHQRWMDCPRCGEMMKRQGYTKEATYLDDQKTRDEFNQEKIRELKYREGN